MALYDILFRKKNTAAVAKDRLQIIVARERRVAAHDGLPDLPKLQQELLAVIAKYEKLDLDQVTVSIDRRENGEVLELNIVLPEPETPSLRPRSRMAFA